MTRAISRCLRLLPHLLAAGLMLSDIAAPAARTDHPERSSQPARAAGAKRAPESAAKANIPQLEAALHATRTQRGLHIVLPSDPMFGSGPDIYAPTADPVLAKLAELIAATRPHEVVVAGHTDGIGSDTDNQALSERRAHAVAAWLAVHIAGHRPRFVEKGYGRTRPAAPNRTPDGSDNTAGRAQNRRIEITLRR